MTASLSANMNICSIFFILSWLRKTIIEKSVYIQLVTAIAK